jgi:CO/xanthine dehydrogenase FAD-binding subunit
MSAQFDYLVPKDINEACKLLIRDNCLALAGGTDVMVHLREGKISPDIVVDLKGLKELIGIKENENEILIGALTPIQSIARSEILKPYTAFIEGASSLGCFEIRNRATLGGNICNASPSADTVPGLLVYDAKIKINSKEGHRIIPLQDFYQGLGNKDLKKGEILTEIILPKNMSGKSKYYRRTRVKGMDLSGVSVAVYLDLEEGQKNIIRDAKVALGSVLPQVSRVLKLEESIKGKYDESKINVALADLLQELKPRKTSIRANPNYKKQMVHVLVKRAINELMGD